MTIMPCIQTLAHLYAIKRWPEYWPHFDTDDILLAGDERVYTLIDHMFRSLAASLSCRTIHLGMDEAEMFARGRYYNQHGDCNRSQALLTHLQRICEIGETYGFRFIMWSDMFFKLATGGQYYAENAQIDESVREKIPANVELVYWDYYSADEAHYDGMIEAHQKLKPGTWFAGGLWKWTGYAPHNGYSMKITKAALASCREHGVQECISDHVGRRRRGMLPVYAPAVAVLCFGACEGRNRRRNDQGAFRAALRRSFRRFHAAGSARNAQRP